MSIHSGSEAAKSSEGSRETRDTQESMSQAITDNQKGTNTTVTKGKVTRDSKGGWISGS